MLQFPYLCDARIALGPLSGLRALTGVGLDLNRGIVKATFCYEGVLESVLTQGKRVK